jgi:hypothetical protein
LPGKYAALEAKQASDSIRTPRRARHAGSRRAVTKNLEANRGDDLETRGKARRAAIDKATPFVWHCSRMPLPVPLLRCDPTKSSVCGSVWNAWSRSSVMPVDVAKAYFEIQRLRREVRKAELDLRISFARSANRPRHPGRVPCQSGALPPDKASRTATNGTAIKA